MDQWLDSLSEDWPSQSPSQQNSSSILQDDGNHKAKGSQSRLPRRSGSGFSSLSSMKGKGQGRGFTAHQNNSTGAPLKERSKSSLNAAQQQRLRLTSSDAVQNQKKERIPSVSSTPPVPAGTVAYKASPTKDACGTPEWKRRVVQGKVGQGDQTDMFGPMGLESVFRPPSTSLQPMKAEKQTESKQRLRPQSGNSPNGQDYAGMGPGNSLIKSTRQLSMERNIAEKTRKHGTGMNDSDLDQSGSNSFSPIVVSQSHFMDGKVDFAAIDHGIQDLHLQDNEVEGKNPGTPGLRPRIHDKVTNDMGSSALSFRKSQINEITNQSLPEDLSVGTDAYAANGAFVSVRRGGYSNEGSFRERSLSPSPVREPDGERDQPKRIAGMPQTALHHPSTSPPRLASPPVTPGKDDNERQRSSGSPLKLFDKYDTFTNNRLARHISRFEETLAQKDTPEAIPEDGQPQPSSPSPSPEVSKKLRGRDNPETDFPNQRVKSFGSGELDDLDFSASSTGNAEPSLPCFPHDLAKERSPRRRGRKVSRESRHVRCTDQRFLSDMPDIEDVRLSSDEDGDLQVPTCSQEVSYTVNGKRLPDSPQKKAARKRRRTLCSSEERKREALNIGRAQPSSLVRETPLPLATGRKRKDARYDNEKQAADPKTLAMRQILRPRNPTPKQTGSYAGQNSLTRLQRNNSSSVNDDSLNEANMPPGAVPNVDPPTQIVAGALATIALNTVQEMETGSRKVSVTTSDFFNEAQQIMALIRAEKRPRSSHTSAETSNLGPSIIHEEVSTADSTKDDLTRPPSREGGSVRNLQLPTQRDARIVSHLRKFEDRDDLGLTLPSSGKSIKVSHYDIATVSSPVRLEAEDHTNDIESDPPNIRIRAALGEPQHGHHAASKIKGTDRQTDKSAEKTTSQSSSQSSSRKSVPTRSSQGSANIKKIAPHSVAHLISDQMADMFFDKERQVWVKRKTLTGQDRLDDGPHDGSEGTEEDLFGGIPDLTVNEMEELKLVKDVVSTAKPLSADCATISAHRQVIHALQNTGAAPGNPQADVRPRTADGQIIQPTENSSAPSKHTNFAWSGPMPGTRATSYGDEVWSEKQNEDHRAAVPAAPDALPSPEVEHEISIFEGRASPKVSRSARKHQPRVVTVAFSSPLIQSPYQPDEDWDQIEQSEFEESPSKQVSRIQVSTKRQSSRSQRRVSRRLSIGNSSVIARPMSRLDEQDEMSLVHYTAKDPQTSTELVMMTPLPPSRTWIAPPQSGQRSSIGFELSPLPDFSVHQIDRPVDAEENRNLERCQMDKVSTALSITAQEILRHLTDLEPFEPYWYYIRKVVLQDRGLTSLHMLDEFCGQIQDLDVSENGIRELDGIPSTVRSLIIRNNCLSELTSWHSLLHLQYLDVSGNQVRSLKGFQDLIHLRSLTADHCEIESLDGIECLDGLMSLRLRNNRLSAISFERSNLKRLAKLDLRGNNLSNVAHLNCLDSLESLNLSMNDMKDLCLDNHMTRLSSLDVADNRLDRIDITRAPNLRVLIIDRNAVVELKGLRTHTRLESLSCREQKAATPFDSQVENCPEIRNLYLTSTCLSPTFDFKIPFLNLNTLEMASMGLQSLPEEFGMMCKNVRKLNLNYNAVHDIRPLLGITRLQNLQLAGNRLSRLRRTAAVLERLSSELLELDLRNNTLTVGFYTPQPISNAGPADKRLVVRNPGSSISSGIEDESDYIAESAKAHLLPGLDKDADTTSRERLDEDTKLRRRVYEMLLVSACKSLQRLDGLDVDRRAVAKRDGVWERLVEIDVLKPRNG